MLTGNTYDVGVMVMFLFQMVFMTRALNDRHRHRRRAVEILGLHRLLLRHGRAYLSALRSLGLGRRLARNAG